MNKAKLRRLAADLACDLAGSFLYAAAISTFIVDAEIATCGVSGLAVSINHLFPSLPIGVLSILLNIPLVIFSFRVLGRDFFLKSLKSMVLVSVIIDLLGPVLPHYSGDRLVAALFGGALMGLGLAIVYSRGSSTGGMDFLVLSLKKLHPHISTGTISIVSDAVIISLGALVFRDVDSFLYGAVSVFAVGAVIDRVSYGLSSGKMMLVVTEHGVEVAEAISRETERGSTIADIRGAYTKREKQLVISALSKSQAFKAKRAVREADSASFIMISSTDMVFGEGFQNPD